MLETEYDDVSYFASQNWCYQDAEWPFLQLSSNGNKLFQYSQWLGSEMEADLLNGIIKEMGGGMERKNHHEGSREIRIKDM